jgi:hypothetical protein
MVILPELIVEGTGGHVYQSARKFAPIGAGHS